LTVPLTAAEPPTITVRKSDALNVAFTGIGGSDGPAVSKILQNDLTLAGWFSLVQPGMATFTVSGTSAGGILQGLSADLIGRHTLRRAAA